MDIRLICGRLGKLKCCNIKNNLKYGFQLSYSIGSLLLYEMATGKRLINLDDQIFLDFDHGHLLMIQEIIGDIPKDMIELSLNIYILALKCNNIPSLFFAR